MRTHIFPTSSIAERLAFGERGQCCVLAQNPKNSDYFRRRVHRFVDPTYCENNWNSSDFALALTPLAKRIPCCDGGGGAVTAGRRKCYLRVRLYAIIVLLMSEEKLRQQEFFDRMLIRHSHFKRYPMMLPFVGSQYESSSHKKVLVLAESHYWPEAIVPPRAAEWYSSQYPLDEAQIKHLHTRGVVRDHQPGGGAKGYTRIFKNFAAEIQLAGFDHDPTMCMDHIAFMNTFQRPASNRRSFNGIDLEEDIKIAIDVVSYVIESLRPDLVCFASTKAWNSVGMKVRSQIQKDHAEICFVNCAHAAWWRFQKKNGREKFRTFLLSAIIADAISNT